MRGRRVAAAQRERGLAAGRKMALAADRRPAAGAERTSPLPGQGSCAHSRSKRVRRVNPNRRAEGWTSHPPEQQASELLFSASDGRFRSASSLKKAFAEVARELGLTKHV